MKNRSPQTIGIAQVILGSPTYNICNKISIGELSADRSIVEVIFMTGTGSLTQNTTVQINPDNSFVEGDLVRIVWLANCTMSGHTLSFETTDLTSALTSNTNAIIELEYTGSAWNVSCTASDIKLALLPYATLASPTFTGTVTVPAISGYADNTTKAAPTSFVQNCITYVQTILAPLASPTFTGTVTIPTVAGTSDSSTKAASTAFVQAVRALLAPLASPALTGTPTSTTPATGDNSTKIATTAFVTSTVAPFQNYVAAGTWAAGTINLTTSITGVYNTVVPSTITGNIVLTASAFGGGNVSEVTIHLPFAGAYTVTAGANMSFTTITGVNTHTSVLTLSWNAVQGLYIQKSASQN